MADVSEAATLVPSDINAVAKHWHDKAVGLANLWKLEASEICYLKALEIQDRADFRANYANLLRRAWRFDDAFREAKRALLGAPGGPTNIDIQGIIGTLHMDRCNMKKAIELLYPLKEQSAFHHFCLALAYLHDGQWEKGFEAYEARMIKAKPVYRIEPWVGQDLKGKTLCIHAEQGFGDTIMYSRFLDLIPPEVDWLLGVPSPLYRLFQKKYGDRVQSPNARLVADYTLPMMSLPYRLGLKDLDPWKQYLEPPIPFVGLAKPAFTKLSVGLIWTSKSGGRDLKPEEEAHGYRKSIPLELLLPLAGIPGVSLFGLQTGDASKDVDKLVAGDFIVDLGWQSMDFADLAGFMGEMDLIVSIDSAPAHLAGALGKPAIVLVNAVGSWQWQSGKHSAWYGPNVEVIRQKRPFDWSNVASELLENVRKRVSAG